MESAGQSIDGCYYRRDMAYRQCLCDSRGNYCVDHMDFFTLYGVADRYALLGLAERCLAKDLEYRVLDWICCMS